MIGRIVCGVLLATSLAFAQTRVRDDDWRAPAKEAVRANPLAGHPDAPRGGAKLFAQRCANCHGDDARGTTKAPDLLQPEVQSQTDGELFWKISTGNTHAGMPSFSYLPELQRWQLVLDVRAVGAAR